MSRPLCLIAGVGDGTGAALVRRFVAGGYRVAMLARTAARLQALAAELDGALPFVCDLADTGSIDAACQAVKAELGDPAVVIHNAVSASGIMQSYDKIRGAQLEANFRVNCVGLLELAQRFAPAMIAKGSGAILTTGNTGAWRGVAHYASFAPTKAAQRILAESLARDLGPKGIHVAHIVVDAFIDIPVIRERLMPGKPDDFFAKPADIAEEFFRIAHQPRSAWSFNVELRPFGEKW